MIEKLEWLSFLRLVNDSTANLHFIPSANSSQDITKAAVSLANQNGGEIVIGYDRNNVQLRGVNFDAKWLNAILYNECKPQITYRIKDMFRAGKRIFVIYIEEGKEKPYSTYGVSYSKQDEKIQPIPEDSLPPQQLVEKKEPHFDMNTREKRCLEYIQEHKEVTNTKYRELNMVSHKTAHNELSDLVDQGLIVSVGQGRSTKYVLASEADKYKAVEEQEVEESRPGTIHFPEISFKDEEIAEVPDLFGDTIETLLKKNNNSTSITDIRKNNDYEHMNAHLIKNDDFSAEAEEEVLIEENS